MFKKKGGGAHFHMDVTKNKKKKKASAKKLNYKQYNDSPALFFSSVTGQFSSSQL